MTTPVSLLSLIFSYQGHRPNPTTDNFATYFVWAGAEIAVAMVCLGIPTLRPLYLKQRGLSIGYGDRAHTHHSDPGLPQFTMCDQKPAPSAPGTPQTSATSEIPEQQQQPDSKSRKPPPRPQTPLLFTNNHAQHIELTSVQKEEGLSSTPNHLRDSSSSHTMVDSDSDSDAVPSPEPPPTRPKNAYLRDRDMSTERQRDLEWARKRELTPGPTCSDGDSDSVDDILGLYNSDRSRSRGRVWNKLRDMNATPEPMAGQGGIWVKNEVWVDVENGYSHGHSHGPAADWPLPSY